MRDGGIWMMIADRVRAVDAKIAVRVLGLARFIPYTAPDEILSSLGLDPARVAKAVTELGGAFRD